MSDLWHTITTHSIFIVMLAILQIDAATKYSVTLNAFEQRRCKTKCLEGLLASEDNLFLSGKVTITDRDSEGALSTVSLQWRENKISTFHDFSLVHLDNCNKHDDKQHEEKHEFYCEASEDSVFNIYLNMTASTLLSEKEVMLIAYPSLEASQVIQLPKIYNANSATLTINGQVVSDGCSNVQLNETAPSIKLCCHGTATPCEVIISHTGVKEVADNGCVSYSVPSRTTSEFTFRSVVCGHPHLSSTYQCNFKQILPLLPVTADDLNKYYIIFTILAVCVVGVIGGIVIYCKCSASKETSKSDRILESAKFKQF